MGVINLIARIAGHFPYTVQKARFFKHFHKWPALKVPVDKLTVMSHYVIKHGIENRNNERWGIMADKYGARAEVERILGPGHLIPLLGKWENPEDIDFEKLPRSFLLKTNNGCATNVFVHDKTKIDRDEIVRTMKKALAFPYPQLTGQLHYSLIKPAVIAEEIIEQDGGHKSLTDYKIHCVNGEPQTLYIFTDRDEVNHFDFAMKAYTADWREMPPGATPDDVKDNPEAPDRPEWLDEMLDIARKLSAGEEYVRVDLYQTNGKILFGEMTYMPETAYHPCYYPYQEAMKFLLDKIIADRKNKA